MDQVLKAKLVSMHLIDPPDLAMRSKMDDGRLAELAQDIQRNGLRNAIEIRARNGRFYIIAGHRRFVACKMLNYAEIESKDYTGSDLPDEAIKFGENFYREDVSDADMADYLHDLRHKLNMDLEQMCRITGQSEDWINKRISLFDGDQAVYEALRANEINLGHALVLNRFPDRYRAQYLATVIDSTPPIRVVEQWLRDFRKMGLPDGPIEAGAPEPTPDAVMPGVVIDDCALCERNTAPWNMVHVKVHKDCLKQVVNALRNGSDVGEEA
jgi:ParB family chromosome partitioning protein